MELESVSSRYHLDIEVAWHGLRKQRLEAMRACDNGQRQVAASATDYSRHHAPLLQSKHCRWACGGWRMGGRSCRNVQDPGMMTASQMDPPRRSISQPTLKPIYPEPPNPKSHAPNTEALHITAKPCRTQTLPFKRLSLSFFLFFCWA